MTFISALKTQLNTTETLNRAKAYSSTLNASLDLFGQIAACRNNLDNARGLFQLAFKENPEAATRILFWARDIRGGQGERDVFRTLFKYIANQNTELAVKLIELVPVYGRWDDLLILEDTKVWNTVLFNIRHSLTKDIEALSKGENVSLLAKWLPSINASSKDSKRIGRKIASYLGVTERQYRKILTQLRNKINIVETPMCAKEWSVIDYSKVPSRASFMYRKAFAKQDNNRYSEYLTAVKNGEAKINAATLYPYDIVREYLLNGFYQEDKTIDLQWDVLPNYMENETFNGLVVADVSGSMGMNGQLPLAVSISLAMYISERNTSEIWKDKYITFSQKPQLHTVVGSTIGERIKNLSRDEWSMNTDLIAVFKVILDAAKSNEVAPQDMPEKLIIVSDMQFDIACHSNKKTNFEQIKEMYKQAGYELPQLVFWNVNSIASNTPITVNDTGTSLVSGCSPSILKSVLNGDILTPVDMMNDVIYSDRYDPIGQAFRVLEGG